MGYFFRQKKIPQDKGRKNTPWGTKYPLKSVNEGIPYLGIGGAMNQAAETVI